MYFVHCQKNYFKGFIQACFAEIEKENRYDITFAQLELQFNNSEQVNVLAMLNRRPFFRVN